jgi:uncharacterized protein YybS (DUF2232 family)
MKNNASLIYSLCLVVGDFIALIAAFVGAYILRVTVSSVPIAHPVHAVTYLGVFLGLAPFWLLIFALLGLYNQRIYEKRYVVCYLLGLLINYADLARQISTDIRLYSRFHFPSYH